MGSSEHKTPLKILVDNREQKPWKFQSIPDDKVRGGGYMVIESTVTQLLTGDYTTERLKDIITIERKSAKDIYQTISQGKKRFTAELQRMSTFKIAIVVIESSYIQMIKEPPRHTFLSPKSVSRTIMQYMITQPHVRWMFLDDRRFAEVWVAKFLAKCEREFK